MRRSALVLLGFFGVAPLPAQGFLPLRVRSCTYADSIMGPMKDDGRADILGVYDGDRDTTFLVTESRGNRRPRVTTSIKLAGKRPSRTPLTQLIVYLRGDDAKAALALAGPPAVTLRLDDSVAINVGTVAFGKFEGPGTGVSIPLSALIPAPDLLSMVQAKAIVLDAEVFRLEFTADERRGLRAVTRVALCPG
jgi:hypothetical protein